MNTTSNEWMKTAGTCSNPDCFQRRSMPRFVGGVTNQGRRFCSLHCVDLYHAQGYGIRSATGGVFPYEDGPAHGAEGKS